MIKKKKLIHNQLLYGKVTNKATNNIKIIKVLLGTNVKHEVTFFLFFVLIIEINDNISIFHLDHKLKQKKQVTFLSGF